MAKDAVPPPPGFPEDGLWGARAIAVFLYGGDRVRETRRVHWLENHSKLPFFRLGGTLCLRRSAIKGWEKAPEEEAAKTDETVADSGSNADPPEGKDETPGTSEI